MRRIGIVFTMIALALLGVAAHVAAAQESILYSFGASNNDASEPVGGLISDPKGNFYGTTMFGGTYDSGTIYELSPKEGGGWTETVLHNFNGASDGSGPLGALALDKDGNLYGTASGVGANGGGTLFEMLPSTGDTWTFKILYNFGKTATDGTSPKANLIFDSEGNLYGTTYFGGAGRAGAVFELSPGTGGVWTEKLLYSFFSGPNGTDDGCNPAGGLIFDAEGNLYGTASNCGNVSNNNGAVFELSPASGGKWSEKVLWVFGLNSGDGLHPDGGLVLDGQGNLYGTTNNGAAPNDGIVFELSLGEDGLWNEKVLWTFEGAPKDGAAPYGTLILDAQGNLYGTTFQGGPYSSVTWGGDGGVLFELSPTTSGAWKESILHNFGAGADGFGANGGLLTDANGNIYGTTQYLGANRDGTAWEADAAGLPTFSPAPGTYTGTQNVTIKSSTKNAIIYYTVDGTTPSTASKMYTAPIAVSATETIKAFATAAGDPNSTVVSAAYIILVQPTVALTLSSSSISTEQALTVKVAVKGPSSYPTPSGSVILTSGSYKSAEAELSDGTSTLVIPAGTLPAGSDALTVSYTPDSASSSSYTSAKGSASVTVSKVTPTVKLTLSAASITKAQSLTVKIAVAGASGDPAATGTVTLKSGTYTSAATSLTNGSATITIPAGALATGTDTLTATYVGSAIYNTASGTASVSVTLIPTTVKVIPAATSVPRVDSLAVAITVSASAGTPAGTVTLSGGGYTSAVTTLTGGKATITIPADKLTVGTDTLTVKFSGGGNYAAATGTATVTVTKITPTVTVTPASSSVVVTSSLSVAVKVTAAAGVPTGTVTLSGGGYTSAATTLTSGKATIVVPANKLAVGTDTLTVNYAGDANDNTASGKASVTVSK